MKQLLLIAAAALGLAGCNAASGVDFSKSAYTSCLDQAVGDQARTRAARNAAVQKAFQECRAHEQALVAAASAEFGAEIGAKAVADGKAAYARRLTAGR